MIIRYEGINKKMMFAKSIRELKAYMDKERMTEVYILWIADSLESPLMINWNRMINVSELGE